MRMAHASGIMQSGHLLINGLWWVGYSAMSGGSKGQNFIFFGEGKKQKESRRPCADCLVLRYADGAVYDGEKLVCRWLAAALRPDLKDPNL